jgi:hypothetical protein
MPDEQPSLFDPHKGRQLANEGIARADDHANLEWKDAALTALHVCALDRYDFTTDQVYEAMDGEWTHERRAMGAVMRQGARAGWIEKTKDFRLTERPEGHRGPKQVWRSLIYRRGS